MSVTLGALVIAISTEFSVLLSSRYRQEREAGAPPARAIELTYASTGAAVLASGVTAIAGFAALIASDIRMLRDFGIVTVVDLSVSLLGVMLVLPAALVWAEQHGPFTLRDLDPRPFLRELRDALGDLWAPPRLSGPRPRRRCACPAASWLRTASATSAAAGTAAARPSASRRRTASGPEPDMPQRPPEVPRAGNKYAWVVGIVMFMGIAVLLFTTALPNTGAGLKGPEPGDRLPAFAAPLATGNARCNGDDACDANVCQRAKDCNDSAGNTPACKLVSEAIFNVCEAREKPLVLTFLVDKGADCNPQVDRAQRMKDEFPGVNFAVVYFSDEKPDEIAEIVKRRKWTMPVAHTADGAVVRTSTAWAAAPPPCSPTRAEGCESKLGPISEDGLRSRARRIVAEGLTVAGPRARAGLGRRRACWRRSSRRSHCGR